jgi:hypothetical protein
MTISNTFVKIPMALAIALFCGRLQAANLMTATPASIALTCDTAAGPGPAIPIVVKPVATLTTNTILVTLGAVSGGLVVTPPASAVLNSANQSQGLTYSVNARAGCAGIMSGSATIRYIVGGVADVTVTATITVTAAASPLAASPVLFTCVRSAGSPVSYTPGNAQTVTITSAAAGGTPFTVDATTIPAWLTITPASGGTALLTGASLTMTAMAPCGNYLAGSNNSVSIHLRNPPAPDGLVQVSLQIAGASPLTASPAAPSLSYTKGSAAPAFVDVALTSANSAPASFTVDPASLPAWLSANNLSGSTPSTVRFTTTGVADSIAAGAYSAAVDVQVSGAGDLVVPFHLAVANPAPKLLVAEGTTRNLSWTVGQPLSPTSLWLPAVRRSPMRLPPEALWRRSSEEISLKASSTVTTHRSRSPSALLYSRQRNRAAL